MLVIWNGCDEAHADAGHYVATNSDAASHQIGSNRSIHLILLKYICYAVQVALAMVMNSKGLTLCWEFCPRLNTFWNIPRNFLFLEV